MPRTTPATPRCAARSSLLRLDLLPSRRLACAWFLWIGIAVAATLNSPLPLPARITLCIAVATLAIRSVATVVLLRGRFAVRRLAWDVNGDLRASLGNGDVVLPARVAAGSFRLGPGLLLLRLDTASGIHTVCIDGSLHDPETFRGLCRWLRAPSGTASRRDSRGS